MATSPIEKVTNNSGSDYCKMPDGTLMQWGTFEFPDAQVGDQHITITLPIAYSSADYSVVLGWNDNSGTVSTYFNSLTALFYKAASQFVAGANRIKTGYAWHASWIAVGRWK